MRVPICWHKRALKWPFPSGCKFTVSTPMSISRLDAYSEMPTLVMGAPVLLSATLTVNTLLPERLGLTSSATLYFLSEVNTDV